MKNNYNVCIFQKHIHSSSAEARKLSVHVVSVAEGGAGAKDDDKTDHEDSPQTQDTSENTANKQVYGKDLNYCMEM